MSKNRNSFKRDDQDFRKVKTKPAPKNKAKEKRIDRALHRCDPSLWEDEDFDDAFV